MNKSIIKKVLSDENIYYLQIDLWLPCPIGKCLACELLERAPSNPKLSETSPYTENKATLPALHPKFLKQLNN